HTYTQSHTHTHSAEHFCKEVTHLQTLPHLLFHLGHTLRGHNTHTHTHTHTHIHTHTHTYTNNHKNKHPKDTNTRPQTHTHPYTYTLRAQNTHTHRQLHSGETFLGITINNWINIAGKGGCLQA